MNDRSDWKMKSREPEYEPIGPERKKTAPGGDFNWVKAIRSLTFWILLVVVSWILFRQCGFGR